MYRPTADDLDIDALIATARLERSRHLATASRRAVGRLRGLMNRPAVRVGSVLRPTGGPSTQR